MHFKTHVWAHNFAQQIRRSAAVLDRTRLIEASGIVVTAGALIVRQPWLDRAAFYIACIAIVYAVVRGMRPEPCERKVSRLWHIALLFELQWLWAIQHWMMAEHSMVR